LVSHTRRDSGTINTDLGVKKKKGDDKRKNPGKGHCRNPTKKIKIDIYKKKKKKGAAES
jgi:hypothetical protein